MDRSYGWMRDAPDLRDYSTETRDVAVLLSRIQNSGQDSVDLRQGCSPVEDQGRLGSCTAQAGVGLLEYLERRAFDKHIDGSRLFLYKATRKLLGWRGDTGAFLRDTMKAMVLFGVPPEDVWPYRIDEFDNEPDAFVYSYAQNYQSLRYYRLDTPGLRPEKVLERVKAGLMSGVPSMFGFAVYSSIDQAETEGRIPYPVRGERRVGGHAVVAVGYNDEEIVENQMDGSYQKGAVLIRNSWGTEWGDAGYGWLPYEYIRRHLAVDWWSLLSIEWVDTGHFGA